MVLNGITCKAYGPIKTKVSQALKGQKNSDGRLYWYDLGAGLSIYDNLTITFIISSENGPTLEAIVRRQQEDSVFEVALSGGEWLYDYTGNFTIQSYKTTKRPDKDYSEYGFEVTIATAEPINMLLLAGDRTECTGSGYLTYNGVSIPQPKDYNFEYQTPKYTGLTHGSSFSEELPTIERDRTKFSVKMQSGNMRAMVDAMSTTRGAVFFTTFPAHAYPFGLQRGFGGRQCITIRATDSYEFSTGGDDMYSTVVDIYAIEEDSVAPFFTTQPTDQNTLLGGTATYSFTADNYDTAQWWKIPDGGSAEAMAGETTSPLVVKGVGAHSVLSFDGVDDYVESVPIPTFSRMEMVYVEDANLALGIRYLLDTSDGAVGVILRRNGANLTAYMYDSVASIHSVSSANIVNGENRVVVEWDGSTFSMDLNGNVATTVANSFLSGGANLFVGRRLEGGDAMELGLKYLSIDNLILYDTLGQFGNTTLLDSSGNGNDGTIVGATWENLTGGVPFSTQYYVVITQNASGQTAQSDTVRAINGVELTFNAIDWAPASELGVATWNGTSVNFVTDTGTNKTMRYSQASSAGVIESAYSSMIFHEGLGTPASESIRLAHLDATRYMQVTVGASNIQLGIAGSSFNFPFSIQNEDVVESYISVTGTDCTIRAVVKRLGVSVLDESHEFIGGYWTTDEYIPWLWAISSNVTYTDYNLVYQV